MDQNPGSSARQQAAAMAGYQAMQQQQQQQQQELEQLQLWHMLQNSRQVGSSGGGINRTAAEMSPLLTQVDLAAATAMQGGVPTSQPLFQNCAGEVSSASINAAMAAGIRGSNAAAAAAAAAAGLPASHLVVQTVSSMPLPTSDIYHHAQGVHVQV